jgi:DNA cross-link repair 1B protein
VRAAPIDVLYLDNTFCHPSYSHPPRAVALHQLREAIGRLIRTGDERLLLGIDTLGKEELLEAVADAIGGAVAVTPARLQSARALGLPDGHLTTCWHEARVVTVPRWRVTPKGLATLQQRHVQSGGVPFTAAVLPTGWVRHVAPAPAGDEAPQEQEGGDATLAPPVAIVQVPYSLHASFAELHRLVQLLAPRAIIGVVASPRYADAPIDPVLHFSHLLRREAATPMPPLPCLVDTDTERRAASRGAAPGQPPVPADAPAAGREGSRRGARREAPHQPGTRSLLTLSPRAMLACMQRAAGNAALAVLATARKRGVRVLALTPQPAAVGDTNAAQENKPVFEEPPLPKRARES